MSVLMTGFPGFLGSRLLPRILARTDTDAVCLVQRRHARAANDRIAELEAEDPALTGRIRLAEGDITRPGLGLDDPGAVLAPVTELWHLAAVYDLAVSRDVALAVNTEGTRYVLEAAARCPGLERFHHFSTCYVSGRRAGVFAEDDLATAGPFNNHYEETKHYAEVEVRRRMGEGLPATIYRPSIVVGDSRTGATQKYDGPYFVLQWLLRQSRKLAVMPVIGDPTMTCVNVVPCDFVIDAAAYLSGLPESAGRTYALADPDPLTVDAMIDLFAAATGRRTVRVPLTPGLARGSIRHIPGVGRLLRMPAEVVNYFAHPTAYLTDHARADLAGSSIEVPKLEKYVDQLVHFMEAHPEITAEAMT
jgi:thioester reductase-like protein